MALLTISYKMIKGMISLCEFLSTNAIGESGETKGLIVFKAAGVYAARKCADEIVFG